MKPKQTERKTFQRTLPLILLIQTCQYISKTWCFFIILQCWIDVIFKRGRKFKCCLFLPRICRKIASTATLLFSTDRQSSQKVPILLTTTTIQKGCTNYLLVQYDVVLNFIGSMHKFMKKNTSYTLHIYHFTTIQLLLRGSTQERQQKVTKLYIE